VQKKRGKCDCCRRWKRLSSTDNVHFRCRHCIKNGVGKIIPTENETAEALLALSNNQSQIQPVIHTRREEIDRWRCIIYHLDGMKKKDIIKKIRTTCKTINRWIKSYNNNKKMIEQKRRGRKRKLSEEQVDEIVDYTKKVKFTTPALVKFHFSLNVSKKTIDRRLIEHNLFGRVGTHTNTHI
jgi:transposase